MKVLNDTKSKGVTNAHLKIYNPILSILYLNLTIHFTIFFVDQVNLIEQIAIEIDSNNFEEMKNSTITAVDFASQKISFDVKKTKKLQSNQEFHKLTELMVDIVGNQIRKKVRHLFDLKGRLWIAR